MDALDIDGNIISTAQITTFDSGDGVVYTENTINGVYIYDYSDDCCCSCYRGNSDSINLHVNQSQFWKKSGWMDYWSCKKVLQEKFR